MPWNCQFLIIVIGIIWLESVIPWCHWKSPYCHWKYQKKGTSSDIRELQIPRRILRSWQFQGTAIPPSGQKYSVVNNWPDSVLPFCLLTTLFVLKNIYLNHHRRQMYFGYFTLCTLSVYFLVCLWFNPEVIHPACSYLLPNIGNHPPELGVRNVTYWRIYSVQKDCLHRTNFFIWRHSVHRTGLLGI